MSDPVDEEKPQTFVSEVKDWNGPDDPDNAQNWPDAWRWFHGFLISGISLVGTFASSAFSPAIDSASSEFGASQELGVLAYSIYVLGLAVGAPFASPLSETLGRRAVFWVCIPIFALFILGSGFSNNMAALIVLRFLAGVFASPSLSIASATLSDMWAPEKRARPFALYVATPFFGPAIGPLIGGAVTVKLGWRWTSWTILFFSIVCFFIPAPFMRESYKKVILQNRARRLGVPGPPRVGDGKTKMQTILFFARSNLTRPFHMFFTEPVVAAFVSYVGFNFALLYSFFAAFQYVFEAYYGFGLIQVGLTFLGVGVGVLVGATIILLANEYYYMPLVRRAKSRANGSTSTSKVPPEKRLPIAMLGGPLITSGLFLFGWSAAYRVHWIAPVIGEAMFGCGNLLVFMSCTTYLMDVYGPLYGASVMASNTITRYLLGFVFPLFSLQMFRGLGVQWACTLFGCVSALGMSIPFVLYRWGPRLRSRIRYEIGN